jgi:hypothetical protein
MSSPGFSQSDPLPECKADISVSHFLCWPDPFLAAHSSAHAHLTGGFPPKFEVLVNANFSGCPLDSDSLSFYLFLGTYTFDNLGFTSSLHRWSLSLSLNAD